MPPFLYHHCSICGRTGDKRCITQGHYLECPKHRGSFRCRYYKCVKCVQLSKRDERLTRKSANKETSKTDGGGAKKTRRAKQKTPPKKSAKKLRKEQKKRDQPDGSG